MQALGIDLGSNTLRAVLLGENDEILWEYERVVRTAEGFAKEPLILPKTIERLCESVRAMQDDFYAKTHKEFATLKTLALATAALRKATNQAEVLDALLKQGIMFQVIDSKQEAIFTLNAALFALRKTQTPIEPFLLLDIGGASTEISLYCGNGDYLNPFANCTLLSQSFDIGIVTLSEQDSITQQHILQNLRTELDKWLAGLQTPIPKCLVASGGVPQTLVWLADLPQCAHTLPCLELDTMTSIKQTYPTLSVKEQIARVGAGRENLILTGIALLTLFFKALNLHECKVATESLREGAALHTKSFS